MAITASYQTVVTAAATTSTALYTTSTTLYNRDLVVTNSGASTLYITAASGATAASSTQGFAIPTGGSVLLTQCQVPTSTILYGNAAASPAGGLSVSIGYGSVVSVV